MILLIGKVELSKITTNWSQNYRKKGRKQVEGGKGEELVYLPIIKDQNWQQQKQVIQKMIYQLYTALHGPKCWLRAQVAKYLGRDVRCADSPCHMVYEPIRKTTLDSKLRVFPFKLLFKK